MTRQKVFWLLMAGLLGLGGNSQGRSTLRQSAPGIAPGYGAIEGRVLDETGRPVSGAKVSSMILDYPPGRLFFAETDAQGHFSLRYARPGRNAVYVGKEDEYYPDTFLSPFVDAKLIPVVNVVEQAVTEGVEVHLPPKGGKLIAQVIDAATQQPVDGASMKFCRADDPNKCCTINATSPNAQFEKILPPIHLTVRVSAPGYEDWYFKEDNDSKEPGKILLTEGSAKRLTILLLSSGNKSRRGKF